MAPKTSKKTAKKAAAKKVKKTVKKASKKAAKKAAPKRKKKKGLTKKQKAEKKRAGKIARKKSSRRTASKLKAAGKGIFAPKKLSKDLQAICGKAVMPRTEVTRAVWAYIKKNKCQAGRTIKPDATLKRVFPAASLDMLKLPGYVSKHLS